ncbi:MAG: CDP-archaeol synthase [Myxococcales bacterium]|nr:CDP-archaeol synthase [Myxococcales bacterium]
MNETTSLAYLLLPLLGGGLVHGICLRYDLFPRLATPIDRGARLGGKPIFGSHKTFRGPLAMVVGTALTLWIQARWLHEVPAARHLELFDYGATSPWFLGAALGLGAALAELPNSFVKRRLGVAPGGASKGARVAVFYFVDQVDLLAGAWIVLASVVAPTASRILISVAIVFIGHAIVSVVGYWLGMRPVPY